MGETAVARQILPGRLRVINHNEAKLRSFHRRNHHHAHLRTQRHHAWIARQPHEANQFERLLVAGDAIHARGAALRDGAKAAGSIDALLAMQGVEDPTERRKRSVARGRGALDVLDELKIGLLSGNLDASTVNRLRDAAANLKSSSGDPGLDAVLSEIELRVEVELAKAGQF
jgi:hypothetical protein